MKESAQDVPRPPDPREDERSRRNVRRRKLAPGERAFLDFLARVYVAKRLRENAPGDRMKPP